MESTGVIQRSTTPIDWVNSLVVVEKPNGKLRICLDPKDLKTAIQRPHYPMPTFDDALSKMAGARHFTKLDAKSGYWNCPKIHHTWQPSTPLLVVIDSCDRLLGSSAPKMTSYGRWTDIWMNHWRHITGRWCHRVPMPISKQHLREQPSKTWS